jgi:hypothetical protein
MIGSEIANNNKMRGIVCVSVCDTKITYRKIVFCVLFSFVLRFMFTEGMHVDVCDFFIFKKNSSRTTRVSQS